MQSPTEKEISCRVTRTLLMYMREQNNGSLGNLIDGLELDEEYLLDPNNWVSHAFLHVLYHRMIDILQDENCVYKFALASGRFESLGLLDGLARLLGSPRLIYSQAPKYNKLLKLNGDVHIHELGDSWVILEDRYHKSTQKTRYDCDYTRGILAGIPTLFGLPLAHVAEIECQVASHVYGARMWPDTPIQGSTGCLYRVEWIAKKRRFFGRQAVQKAIEDLQEANRRIQDKYEEVKRLATDIEAANRQLLESRRQLELYAADLRVSEERYRFLADNVSDIIWTFSLETMRFTYISPSVQKMRGFTPEESMRMSLRETLAPQSLEVVMEVLVEELAMDNQAGVDPNRHRTIEVQQLCKGGSYRWAEAMISFIRNDEGRPIGVVGVSRDISERKQAEEALLYKEAELREAQRIGHIGNWDLDLTTGLNTDESEELRRIFGTDPDLPLPSFRESRGVLFPQESWDHISAAAKQALRDGDGNELDVEARRLDGKPIWITWRAEAKRDAQGRTVGLHGTIQDITERKLIEEELRRARDELEQRVGERTAQLARSEETTRRQLSEIEAYYNMAPVGLAIFDRQLRYVRVNQRLAEMNGIPPHDHLGQTAREVVPNLADWFDNIASYILETGNPVKDIEVTTEPDRAAGVERTWRLNYFPLNEPTGERIGLGAIVEEITEKKRLEEELRQSHKMEAIGTLAGGIAHDFNNMLGIIMGNAELALDDVHQEEPRRNLEAILEASKRSRDLVRQILTFSRKGRIEEKAVDMASLLRETQGLLRSSLPTTIRIDVQIQTESGASVIGDASKMQQVILNLASNAAHAMREKGGTLSISLLILDVGNELSGPYVKLTVSDTGTGIPPEIRSRIFEPFFTTKEQGQGTGMGLAVVYGIVKDFNGRIEVESESGRGTTFNVLFPLAPVAGAEEPESEPSLRSGKEHILLVDDEAGFVEMASSMLKRLGYRVTSLTDSLAAIRTFIMKPQTFDLIITDQTMPDITGIELARKALGVRTDMPIILCTGYSETVSPDMAREAGIREFIMKPIRKKEMVDAIRRALETRIC